MNGKPGMWDPEDSEFGCGLLVALILGAALWVSIVALARWLT